MEKFQSLEVAVAVWAVGTVSVLGGIYSGPVDTATYNQLVSDVEAKAVALSNKMVQAQAAGVNTDYAQVTQVTLNLFKDTFTPWDRANPTSIDDAYGEKSVFATADPVYAAYGAAGLPFDELSDCIEIADAAMAELDRQITNSIALQAPPDFSSGTMTLNGTHYELDGRKVIPSRFFWQPENNEAIWNAFGRMGATYYGLRPHMAETNQVNNGQLGVFRNDISNLMSFNASPVENWHATVSSSAAGHWLPDDYPYVLEEGRRFFNHYDIDNPLVRQWESNLFAQVLAPGTADLDAAGGLRYNLLNNEPRFPIRQGSTDAANNVSVYTYDKFEAWLQAKYSTIGNLNATYGTAYADFATAATANYVVDDGVSEGLQGGPIWYDWCRFNQIRVNEWLEFLNNSVKAIDSSPSTHIKVWGEGSIHTDYQDQGIDYEYLSKMVDLPGSDSQCTPFRAEYKNRVNDDWENRYAFEWRAQGVMMDFIKSMSPDKPYLDSEWHGFVGTRWRDFHMEEEYVRAILWMAAQQGLSSINAWFWNRWDGTGAQAEGAKRSNSEFAGSPVVQPIVMNAYGRVMKEINAHAETFASLVPEQRFYMVYYNNDSAIQDRYYSDNMTDVYEALKLLNVPVGFTTPTEFVSMTNSQQTLIVPRTEFISDVDLAALQTFAAGGGSIVLVDDADCFLYDELGTPRSGGAGFTPLGTVDHGEIYTMAGELETVLAPRTPNLPVSVQISDSGGTNQYGVICSQYRNAHTGELTVSLINISRETREVSLLLSGAVPHSIVDVITGQSMGSSITMASQDVLLLRMPEGDGLLWDAYIDHYDLSGVRTNNQDSDALDDWSEYVFGGDPTNSADIGSLPSFDVSGGDYIFDIRNDTSLVAFVMTKTNLSDAAWQTNSPVSIPSHDGTVGTLTNYIGISNRQLFISLIVGEYELPDIGTPVYQLIVGNSVGNGDFEAGTPSSGEHPYSAVPGWFNGSGSEAEAGINDTQMAGSSQSNSHGGLPLRNQVQLNSNGYTVVAAGEVFSLVYDFGAGGGPSSWDGDEVMRAFLFTSSSGVGADTIVSDLTELGGDSYLIDRANDGQWTTRNVPVFYTTTSADVGKTVFLGLEFMNNSGNTLKPRIDVIQLEVNK